MDGVVLIGTASRNNFFLLKFIHGKNELVFKDGRNVIHVINDLEFKTIFSAVKNN